MERYFLVFIFHFYVSNLNFVAYDPPVLYNESDFFKNLNQGQNLKWLQVSSWGIHNCCKVKNINYVTMASSAFHSLSYQYIFNE